MAGASLLPFNIIFARNCFNLLNPPVTGIIFHFGENFICFAHRTNDTVYNILLQVFSHLFSCEEYRRLLCFSPAKMGYSHSIVAGGLLVISYTTRLIPATSLTMRFEILASRSCGRRVQSAVMKSSVDTARMATAS